MKWYAIAVIAGQEKRTRERILERLEKSDQEIRGLSIFAPEEEIVVRRGDSSERKKRMSMPGYLLLCARSVPSEALGTIARVQGVFEFLGGNDQPTPLPASEVERIISAPSSEKSTQRSLYSPGDLVSIIEGPLSDFSGTVVDINSEKEEARVEVEIFGRQTKSTIPLRSLRPGG